VQGAWSAFHRGDFQHAWETGVRLGPPGVAVAAKVAGVYAAYLETNPARAEQRLLDAATVAERAEAAAPGYANAHYFHAFVLGRYSQRISVLKALAAGHAHKVRRSLEAALELEPKHADAHIALGAFHAEVIDKVGSLLGRTQGASKDAGLLHYKTALKLNPTSAIAMIEYANGLVMLEGDKRMKEATKLYEDAAACEPLDATERLDVEMAKAELED
jgi:tetratricopeptide (TPR) repeat protein